MTSPNSNSHNFKKHLGQNFLTNESIIAKILKSHEWEKSEHILEIGPGQGALTQYLIQNNKPVTALEMDQDCVTHLNTHLTADHLKVIHTDVLQYDFKNLPKQMTLISNLPYNIASPIIEKVIHHKERFDCFYMTVQHEFGKRLVAQPGSKDYGSLSCFVQYHGRPKILFRIRNTAFHPKPKVESCFIKYELFKTSPYSNVDEDFLFQIIRTAFQQRRKNLLNSLASIIPKSELESILNELNIDTKLRAENLSIEEYIRLCNKKKTP